MSYTLLVLLLGSFTLISAETSSVLHQIKERLENLAQQLPIKTFEKLPDASSYLNDDLTNNNPHIINVNEQLTSIIREWTPRLLVLDPTSPYYFSKFNNISEPEHDRNLLSYLQAIETNETFVSPFVSVLPHSYRNALQLLSVFHCDELIHPTVLSFFHNIELIVGPGQTELPIERQSDMFSKLYCSLYGSPQFILLDPTKLTYDAEILLTQENLSDTGFSSTRLQSGTCLYVPPDWIAGAQLNNSISLVYTLKTIENKIQNETDNQPLLCTSVNSTTLNKIDFTISDEFNGDEIGFIVYFYQYLNPPVFDRHYTNETFFEYFQQDRNVSQLVMKWTPALTTLIKTTLFKQLDVNKDDKFSAADYFAIKRTHLTHIQGEIHNILEELRQVVISQYNELNEAIVKMTQQAGNLGSDENAEDNVLDILASLPDIIKEKLKEIDFNGQAILDKMKDKRPKRPSRNRDQDRHSTRDDDASMLFDKDQNEDIIYADDQEEEEEITAEPFITEKEPHRTDL
ncbi:unnamed protein product [Rotaria socialis]|uniref:EF-hand domain-containing protein n=1 Tax=Rotaria socialis TaxID=392032 RepID=A0A818X5S4_9BILA|nr:unnamed protein product [Rotaria socialis]CAF4395844.1 unnamed protein product [Rotaria socialis]